MPLRSTRYRQWKSYPEKHAQPRLYGSVRQHSAQYGGAVWLLRHRLYTPQEWSRCQHCQQRWKYTATLRNLIQLPEVDRSAYRIRFARNDQEYQEEHALARHLTQIF